MATINPFQGPINYSVDVQSPFEAALGGFKIGAAGAEVQAQRQAQEKAKTYQTGIDAFFAKPAAQRTYADIEPLLVGANKQQFDALQAVAKNMGDEKVNSSKRFTGQLLVALEQNPETAKKLLNNRIEAETDPQQKLAFQDTLKVIEISPAKAANDIELLGAAAFGKEWYEGITSVRSERRTAAAAPAELRKKLADADAAESAAKSALAKANTAQEVENANRDLVKAQAESATVKAEFARANEVLDVQQKGAQLGLTKAQTNQAMAMTKKLGEETQKATLELAALKATGGLDPEKTFAQEEKIRKEWQGRSKVYSELGSTFNNIKASAETGNGPGDIALITSFMKMLDPGSVVRETEFATARDTAGLFTQLENRLQNAKDGQLLNAAQRKEYVALSQKYLESAQKKAGDEKKQLSVVVKNYRLNPENVFGPEPSSVAGGGRGVVNPGQRSVTVDY